MKLIRFQKKKNCVLGKLFISDNTNTNEQICYTLENHHHLIIPNISYKLKFRKSRDSSRLPYEHYDILNTMKKTKEKPFKIKIHIGQFYHEVEGSIIVGEKYHIEEYDKDKGKGKGKEIEYIFEKEKSKSALEKIVKSIGKDDEKKLVIEIIEKYE